MPFFAWEMLEGEDFLAKALEGRIERKLTTKINNFEEKKNLRFISAPFGFLPRYLLTDPPIFPRLLGFVNAVPSSFRKRYQELIPGTFQNSSGFLGFLGYIRDRFSFFQRQREMNEKKENRSLIKGV